MGSVAASRQLSHSRPRFDPVDGREDFSEHPVHHIFAFDSDGPLARGYCVRTEPELHLGHLDSELQVFIFESSKQLPALHVLA